MKCKQPSKIGPKQLCFGMIVTMHKLNSMDSWTEVLSQMKDVQALMMAFKDNVKAANALKRSLVSTTKKRSRTDLPEPVSSPSPERRDAAEKQDLDGNEKGEDPAEGEKQDCMHSVA
jgi:hypothetical protein